MVEVECYCDTCEKTVEVEKVKITVNGKFLCYLKCGHGSGFVFDAKLVHFLLLKAKTHLMQCANCGKMKPCLPNGLCGSCAKELAVRCLNG